MDVTELGPALLQEAGLGSPVTEDQVIEHRNVE